MVFLRDACLVLFCGFGGERGSREDEEINWQGFGFWVFWCSWILPFVFLFFSSFFVQGLLREGDEGLNNSRLMAPKLLSSTKRQQPNF